MVLVLIWTVVYNLNSCWNFIYRLIWISDHNRTLLVTYRVGWHWCLPAISGTRWETALVGNRICWIWLGIQVNCLRLGRWLVLVLIWSCNSYFNVYIFSFIIRISYSDNRILLSTNLHIWRCLPRVAGIYRQLILVSNSRGTVRHNSPFCSQISPSWIVCRRWIAFASMLAYLSEIGYMEATISTIISVT